MGVECLKLLEFAISRVDATDVAACAPRDPGYLDYVDAYSKILRSREMPSQATFDIVETMGLTWWADADQNADPQRFRRFRTFTNAVGMAMCAAGVSGDDVTIPNYLAISLIDDSRALRDADQISRLIPPFDEFRALLREQNSEESLFLTLGRLLLGLLVDRNIDDASRLADELIAEESRYSYRASGEFMWGCTHFNQFHGKWKNHVEQILIPNTESLNLLRHELLAPGSA